MKSSSILSKASVFAILLALFVGLTPASGTAESNDAAPYYYIDLLYLNHGKGVDDAEDYFRRLGPIATRHGLKRVDTYSVSETLQGKERADLVNIWWVAGPKTFGGISNDSEYKKLTKIRDVVFDMSRSLSFNANVSR
jgi:hypothetical protein